MLNDCFAQEVADAVLYSKIGGDNFIQNNRLRSYAHLCGKFVRYALTQTVNRILNSGSVPARFYDLDEVKSQAVTDANKKSTVAKLQHNAHTLKHFVATRSVSNYCKVYPEQVAFGLCALVGISYLLYRGYTGQQEPDTTDDESKNPLDTNQ